MGTAHPSFFGRMDTKEGVLMELKELCEKTFKIFDIKSTDELSQALFDVCKNNDSDKIDMFVNTVQDLSVDWLQKIFQYYQADRKEKMQDYTPKTLAELVGRLCGDSNTVIDMCAGSGALTIQKWNQNHDMKFILYEFDERVIPYLIFKIETLTAIGAVGSALLFRAPDGNLTYGCWEAGLYSYPGYYTGGPSDWSGLMLVAPRDTTGAWLKIAFSRDGHIYTMRQESDGSVSLNWTQV